MSAEMTEHNSSSTTGLAVLVCLDLHPIGLKMVSFNPTLFYRAVTIVLCVLNGVLCPLTVSGNVLVFMAVLRKYELRTVANTAILCLAFTDFIVGVVVQPSYVVYQASKLWKPQRFPCRQLVVYSFLGVTCICFSFLTLILISLERYMAVFYPYFYVAKVSSQRVVTIVVTVWVTCVGIVLAVRFIFGINSGAETAVISILIVTNFLVTSFVYFRIFQPVKRCNVQVSELSQPSASVHEVPPSQKTSNSREAEALAMSQLCTSVHEVSPMQMTSNSREAKASAMSQLSASVHEVPPTQMTSNSREVKASKTVAYVAGTLFLYFMPTLCATILDQAKLVKQDLLYHVIYPVGETVVLLNSFLNPGVYVWRSTGIRRSLWELLRTANL